MRIILSFALPCSCRHMRGSMQSAGRAAAFLAVLGLAMAHSVFAQDENDRATQFLAWTLGSKLGQTAVLYDFGQPVTEVNVTLDRLRPVARMFRSEIPPLPPKTGSKTRDSAAVMDYLFQRGDQIGPRMPGRLKLLFELGLKSNILLIMYGPEGDFGDSMADLIRDRATRAGLPYSLWGKLVNDLYARVPYDAMKVTLVRMHTMTSRYLRPPR